MHTTRRRSIAGGIVVLTALALSACGVGTPEPAAPDDADEPSSAEQAPAAEDDAAAEDSAGVTVAGTGVYTIGGDIPYGGFQLHGEPAPVPDGCTWSIQDESGGIVVENQGAYAFLTDVPEYVTFHTDGCPEWEQFE
ncbi:hypothetical protein [Microbacterium sp. LBN7]|uniref:hypothetical protein n=1 Tax=Microbacterium sp. LBN7 TaxID=3129773 RepID=UPI003252D3F1